MIITIDWDTILEIWSTDLWPNRVSAIEPNSAMRYLQEGYDMKNMEYPATFFGYKIDDRIVGVNSGHMCSDFGYRSRGLWVNEEFRGRGIGQLLLAATINQAKTENASYIWSYPRKTSWTTYKSVGFELSTNWETSETSDNNAYCVLFLGKRHIS